MFTARFVSVYINNMIGRLIRSNSTFRLKLNLSLDKAFKQNVKLFLFLSVVSMYNYYSTGSV